MIHKKKFVACILFFVISSVLLIAYTLRGRRKPKSVFEIDLYDDGDYDETERLRVRTWNVSYRDKGWILHKLPKPTPPKPTSFVPQIVVQDQNEPIVIKESTPLFLTEEKFFRYLEQKDVICKRDERLGSLHDGGWNVCMSPPFGLHKPCLVYSFGIGDDWRFEDVVSERYGCQVMAYDPSLKGVRSHNRNSLITFKKFGIGERNGTNHKNWRMKTLQKFFHDEGHSNDVIDYLKFDIEFGEWKVLLNIIHENALRNVKQIGFEIHTLEFFSFLKNPRLKTDSTVGDYLKMFHILKELERVNFRQFNFRKNPFGEFNSRTSKEKRSCCYEVHYVNMNFVSSNYTVLYSDIKKKLANTNKFTKHS